MMPSHAKNAKKVFKKTGRFASSEQYYTHPQKLNLLAARAKGRKVCTLYPKGKI